MDTNQPQNTTSDWMDNLPASKQDYEGQLAIDVHQTPENIVIRAPIAGVKPEDLEISITDDIVNIKGERKNTEEIADGESFIQECYWGGFSRSYILPIAVNAEKAIASMKNGILIVKIPKLEKTKTTTVEIKTEE